MPLTPEEKRQRVIQAGLNPDEYTFVESPEFDPASVYNPVDNTPKPPAPVSASGAFGSSLLRSLIPSAATFAGMRAGAALPTVPHPIFGPILKGAEILGGGLAASLGTGYGQEKVLKSAEGDEAYNKNVEQYEQGRQQHPIASAFGELAPMSLGLGPGGVIGELGKVFTPATISKAKLLQAAAGGTLAGGVEAGREYLQGEDISPGRIAAYGVGGGLLQNTPNKLGQKILGPHFRPPELPPVEVINAQPKVQRLLSERTGPIITPPPDEILSEPVGKDYLKYKQILEDSGPNASAELSKSPTPLNRQIPLQTGGPVIAEPSPLKNYTLDDVLNNSEVADLFYNKKKITVDDLSNILRIDKNKAVNLMREWNTPENTDLKPVVSEAPTRTRTIDEGTKYYQEGQEGVKRKVPFPGMGNESGDNSSEPIMSFREETDPNDILRGRMDREDIKRGRMFVKEGPQYNAEGKRILQEQGEGQLQNAQDLTTAQQLASKRGVALQQEPGLTSDITGKQARGYAIPSERRAVINPDIATSDTGPHEVGHNYLRDLRESSNIHDRAFYDRGVSIAGSEEALTEAIGKRVSDIESKPLRTWVADSANYLGSKLGVTEEDTVRGLARRLRDDRPYVESPEFHSAVGEVNKYYSEAAPVNQDQSTTREGKGTSSLKLSTGPFKSVVDTIAEQSPVAAKAVENAEREQTRLNGKITNSFIENASKIKDKQAAVKYIWESRYNEGKPTTILNPADKALIDGPINQTYRLVHEEQRANGPLINGREAIDNPNLRGPNVISQGVLDTILHKPQTSVERKKLINDFVEHQVKYGEAKTPEEALARFNEIKRGFSAAGGKSDTAAFNALRKAEGIGIPFSWMEKDPVKLFQRYGNRVARDLAYYRNIESKPEVSALFGHTSLPGVEPVAGQAIQTAQRRLTGQHTTSETLYNAVEHAVRSLILGPVTGIKNTISTFAQTLPYVPFKDLPKVAEAFTQLKKGWVDSMKMGVNRHAITGLETGDVSGVGRFAENLRSMGDIIRKYTGANAIEQWTRAHNMALGEILTENYWGRAAKGDIEARKFLRQFAPEGDKLDFRNLSSLPESTKLETAARFTERIQGTYGLRGLPSFLLEPTSPFYWLGSLSKWSVEKANVITKDILQPAVSQGDFGPLLRYTLGGMITGEAVREITAALNNKKVNTPDIKEIQDKGSAGDWAYKAFELSNLAGLGGMYSDVVKMAGDIAKGYNTRGYSIPSVELAKDITTEVGNASAAIQEGQNPLDVVTSFATNLLTDNIQAIRMVANSVNQEDMDRADKFRDKRIYDKLEGKNVPPPQGRTDRYGSMAERNFKRAKTAEEGKKILEEDIKPKLQQLPKEERKKEVSGLKRNNYQTVPADKKEADAYYSFIRRTQGVDAMVRLKKDKEEQDKVNRVKSRLVR
jgi:hypothetical protein